MVKNSWLVVVIVLFVVACAPKGEHEGAAQTAGDAIHAENFEDVNEEPEVPPLGSLPLSEIVASVEVVSHHTITEAEFEDGVWKIEFVMDGEEYELQIDPMTGEALSEAPVRADRD